MKKKTPSSARPPKIKKINGRDAAIGKTSICHFLPFSVRTLDRHIEALAGTAAAKKDPIFGIIRRLGPATGVFAYLDDLQRLTENAESLSQILAPKRKSRAAAVA